MRSERGQQKDHTAFDSIHSKGPERSNPQREKQISGCLRPGMGMWGLEEIGGNWSRIQECFLGGYKNVLKFITVMAALQCDYTKKH